MTERAVPDKRCSHTTWQTQYPSLTLEGRVAANTRATHQGLLITKPQRDGCSSYAEESRCSCARRQRSARRSARAFVKGQIKWGSKLKPSKAFWSITLDMRVRAHSWLSVCSGITLCHLYSGVKPLHLDVEIRERHGQKADLRSHLRLRPEGDTVPSALCFYLSSCINPSPAILFFPNTFCYFFPSFSSSSQFLSNFLSNHPSTVRPVWAAAGRLGFQTPSISVTLVIIRLTDTKHE